MTESVFNWFLAVLNVFFTIYKIRILSRVKCVILLSFLQKRSKSLKIVSNSALIVESSIFVKNDQKLTGFRVIKMILFQFFLEASLWFAGHLNSSFLTPNLNTRQGVSWSRFKLKKTYQSFPILCFSFYLCNIFVETLFLPILFIIINHSFITEKETNYGNLALQTFSGQGIEYHRNLKSFILKMSIGSTV